MKRSEFPRIAVFRHIVRDHMEPPPPLVKADTTGAEVLRILRETPSSSVLVHNGDRRPTGIITERDAVRRLTHPASQRAGELANTPLHSVQDSDYLYHAIANMRRRELRHMPVCDADGRVVGILHLHKAMAVAAGRLLHQIDRLTHEESLEGLQHVKEAQVEVAERLFEESVPVPEIQGLLTQVNNDIYRRIVQLVMADMRVGGWGDPPVDFCVIVMGSGGRGESFLFPDQDNGFILEDYPDEQHPRVDRFFIELGERMTRALDDVGITLCRGFVMATNPLWRKSISQWQQQIGGWLKHPGERTLRLSDIFFDFASVSGNATLATRLRDYLTGRVAQHHGFLRQMQAVQADHNVALGLFGRLTPDNSPGPHRGDLNLKYHGLMPLVESTRLMALRHRVAATGTLERLDALLEGGQVDNDEHASLADAFSLLTRIVLRQQIRDFRQARPVTAYVPPSALPLLEKRVLREALRIIAGFKDRVKTEMTGDVF
jgi:signal-transduction protein with cAMP-binding, CBS, and nucleotidyltransferase domain